MQNQLFVIDDSMEVVSEDRWVQYRDVSCIYAIRHIDSGKVYIGSAVDLYRRWKQHRHTLMAKNHRNRKLQNAWNKYGKSAFQFIIVTLCAKEDTLTLEQEWLDKTCSASAGYNILGTAGSALGFKHSPETRAKVSAAKKGKRRSEETKAKQSVAMTGRKRSEESRAKQSATTTGRKHSAEQAAKAAAARTAVGRQHSEDTKKKLSELAVGRKPSEATRRKISLTSTGRTHSPETRAKISAGQTGLKRSDEFKKKMSDIRTGKPLSDEHKEALSRGRRAASPITPEIAAELRARYVPWDKVNGSRPLSREFGLSPAVVNKIVNGKHWA